MKVMKVYKFRMYPTYKNKNAFKEEIMDVLSNKNRFYELMQK